jgi:putative transposase
MANEKRRRYTSDLTDKQWNVLKPHIPPAKHGGRPREHTDREIVNGILYRAKNGCSWRDLPKDFPPGKTVFHYFRAWALDGTLKQIHQNIRNQAREKVGRDRHPSACIVDSQSVETSKKGDSEGLIRQRRSKAENAIFSSTR